MLILISHKKISHRRRPCSALTSSLDQSNKHIILRNICIKMIPVRDKKIIIREKSIRFSLYFQRYISSFSRLCLNATLLSIEFKSAYMTKRVILALKLESGLSILLIRFSVLGGLSSNLKFSKPE